MRRELGNSDQALDLLPRDFRLVTSGSATATIANSIANSNRLLSDMIGILPGGDYPIFQADP